MYIWELILIAVSLSADAFAVSMCRGLEMRRVNVRHAFVIALFFGLFQAAMPVIGYFAAKLVADYITAYDHWIAFCLLALLGAKMIYDGIKEGAEERKRRKEARDVTAPALPCPAGEKTETAANLAATANLAETAAPDLTEAAAANGQGAEAEGNVQAASACACKGKGGATGERLDVKKLLVMSVATSIDALAIGVTFAFLDVNLWLAVSLIGGITFALSLGGVFLGHCIGAKFKDKATVIGGAVLVLIGLKILLEHLGVISF